MALTQATDQGTVCVVTGASSGIGAELAAIFGAKGHRVVLIARHRDRLEEVAARLIGLGAPRPIIVVCDLAERETGETIAKALNDEGVSVGILVNNAGFGLLGAAVDLSLADQLALVDVNIRALTDLSLRFAGDLIRNQGAILNVGSVAGFLPGPYMAAYYASKAFVVSFSEALHSELAPRGVRVSVLCPGPVPTGFQARAGFSEGRSSRWLSLSAGDVAQMGYDGLMAGRRMVIPGVTNKVVTLAARLLPRSLVLAGVAAVQRRRQD